MQALGPVTTCDVCMNLNTSHRTNVWTQNPLDAGGQTTTDVGFGLEVVVCCGCCTELMFP